MVALRGSIKIALGIVYLLAVGVGCATVPMADTSADANAKQFQTAPGMANIYFCRGEGLAPELLAYTHLDGQMVGALAHGTYELVSVAPGSHIVSVTGPTNVEQLPVDAVAGNSYFFIVTIRWAGPGIRHRHIEAMSDADGRSTVNSLSRAETMTTMPSAGSP
jgi:hypothetical protein